MTEHAPIDDYLARLGRELDLPRRPRADVLAEAQDHLLCAVAELRRGGRSATAAAHEAVARFGSPQLVARGYARASSGRATARLGTGVCGSVGAFAALFAVTTQIPAVHAGTPATAVTSGAAGVVGSIAVQLALACGVLAVIRCRRVRGEPECRSGALRLANRSAATALGAVGISLLIDVAAFVRMPAGQGQHAALVFGLVLAALAATAVALAQVLVARRRLRALERHGSEPASEDAFDDVRFAALAILDACAAAPIAGRLASAVRPLVARTLGAGSPLARAAHSHPWRFGAAVALLAGLLAGGAHLAAEGPPAAGVAVAALVVAIIATIEGAAVFGCYLLFGRFLAIRSPGAGRAC